VGLHLNPPDQVLALCLHRVPRQRLGKKKELRPDERPESTVALLEALGALAGVVVGDSRLRPRQQAFLGFLRRVERAVPSGTPIHLVVDREGTHRQDYAQSWLKRRRYFHLHPAPAGSTWLNWAAAWLKELSRKRTRPQMDTLERAIADYRAGHQPQPFSWTAPAEKAR
jgi:putative transposase